MVELPGRLSLLAPLPHTPRAQPPPGNQDSCFPTVPGYATRGIKPSVTGGDWGARGKPPPRGGAGREEGRLEHEGFLKTGTLVAGVSGKEFPGGRGMWEWETGRPHHPQSKTCPATPCAAQLPAPPGGRGQRDPHQHSHGTWDKLPE